MRRFWASAARARASGTVLRRDRNSAARSVEDGHRAFGGFMQEPPQITNLSSLLVTLSPEGAVTGAPAHIPTTLDYAIRVTQREHPHFTFDIGVGQVAGTIGTTLTPTDNPCAPFAPFPVNLQARHVVATGLSYRY